MGTDSIKYHSLLFFLFLAVCYGLPNIRAALTKLDMKSKTQGDFRLLFNAALPDKIYNQMTTVGYVANFQPLNGIYVNASCPTANSTQTNMLCSVKALNNNINNIVYLTYVVSDESQFLCGTFSRDFIFDKITNLSTSLTVLVPPNGNSISFKNAPQVGVYLFISGVSSADSDFSLAFGDGGQFNTESQTLTLSVEINEMHQKNITVTFGFLVYNTGLYHISYFTQLNFNPNDTIHSMLYGMSQILSEINSNAPKKTPINKNSRLLSIDSPSLIESPQQEQPSPDSTTTAEEASSQPIEVTTEILQKLKDYNGVLKVMAVSKDKPSIEQNVQQSQMINRKSAPHFLPMLGTTGGTNIVNSLGQDNQLFNRLFSTNGFVIANAASSIDQVYYFEVEALNSILLVIWNGPRSPKVPKPSKDNNQTNRDKKVKVLFKSVIDLKNEDSNITCEGKVVRVLSQVDYIQQSYVNICIECPYGQYLNIARKECQDNPIIQKCRG